MRRRKYLHIIASVDPAQGGPIEAVRQFAQATGRRGYQAEVVSLDDPDAPFVKTCPLPVHALGPGGGGYRLSPRLAPWLRDHAQGYDAAVLDGLWTYSSFGSFGSLKRAGVPYVVFPHGMLDPYFNQFPLKHLKKNLYWPWAERRVLRDAQAVCFTCDEERLLARQSFRPYTCREAVTPLGIADPAPDPAQSAAQRAAFLAAFPQLTGCRFLLFLGRIHPKKGGDLLVEAFADAVTKAGDSAPNLRLVMAGPDGEGLTDRLQERARALGVSDQIVWTGMLTGDLKWGAFHAAEAFVLPSHQENFGIAVAEALACGLPVLISNKVNIWREIEADGAGFVDDDTPDGTARLLARWNALAPAPRAAMGERARACYQNHFEIENAAAQFLRVLEGNDAASYPLFRSAKMFIKQIP